MRAMRARLATLAAAAVATAGCGEDEAAFPAACSVSASELAQALRAAPRPVALGGTTRLSECVRLATSDGDLQELGAAATTAADRLALRASSDPARATELGYLVSAARRGAARTAGVHAELIRRLESTIPPALEGRSQAALTRGLSAGRRFG